MMSPELVKEKRIPDDPGVYLMKDSEGKIIYIGKARNLRKRVASYFTKHVDTEWKTAKLVGKICDIEFVVTDNEIEAFLLESNLIKRYRLGKVHRTYRAGNQKEPEKGKRKGGIVSAYRGG